MAILNSFNWFLLKNTLKRKSKERKVALLTIMITIGLYSSILFMIDSIGSGWMNDSRTKAGNQDFIFYTPSTEEDYSVWEGMNINSFNFTETEITLENSFENTIFDDSIIYPRYILNYTTSFSSEGYVIATDTYFEIENSIIELDETEGRDNADGLKTNECYVNKNYATEYKLEFGDTINLTLTTLNYTENYIIVGFYGKKTINNRDNHIILIDLPLLWDSIPEIDGLCNLFSLTLFNPEEYYDFFSIQKTETNLMTFAGSVLEVLGKSIWQVGYEGLDKFDNDEELRFMMTFMVNFFTLISFIFCGFMYYNYLNTSVSDKIRDYGILKSLGAKKKQLFLNLFLHGFVLGAIGTIVGIFISYMLFRFLVINIYNSTIGSKSGFLMEFTPTINSGVMALGMGFLVPLFTSIILSYKLNKWTDVEMLHPEHKYESTFSNQKFNSFHHKNIKGISFSIIIILFLYVSFSIVPGMFVTNEFVEFFQNSALFYFTGIVCVSIILWNIFKPLMRIIVRLVNRNENKIGPLLSIGLEKHLKRNKSIILFVIILFSNCIAALSLNEIIAKQSETKFRLEVGTNLTVYSYPDRNGFTNENLNDIKLMSGVTSVSGVISFPMTISSHMNYFYEQNYDENNFDVPEYDIQFSDLFGNIKGTAYIWGIDNAFANTIFHEEVVMHTGDFFESINKILTDNSNMAMISTETADLYDLQTNDQFKLIYFVDDIKIEIIYEIVGIYDNVPGLFQRRGMFDFGSNQGVIINQNDIIDNFGLPTGESQYVNRIFIRKSNEVPEDELFSNIDDYLFDHDLEGNIDGIEESYGEKGDIYDYIQFVLFILLFLLILLGISGFLATSYSTFLERQTEIKIYRSLGLSLKDILKLIFSELAIILGISGVLGVFGGLSIAYLLSNMMGLFFNNGTKANPFPPFGSIFMLFICSFSALYLLFKRVFKKKLSLSLLGNIQFNLRDD